MGEFKKKFIVYGLHLGGSRGGVPPQPKPSHVNLTLIDEVFNEGKSPEPPLMIRATGYSSEPAPYPYVINLTLEEFDKLGKPNVGDTISLTIQFSTP